MKNFNCSCGNRVNYQNYQCVSCNAELGFQPDSLEITDFHPVEEGLYRASNSDRLYKKCANYSHYNVCNWLVDADDDDDLCLSCRMTQAIPNLNIEGNLKLWYRMEDAKRRLLYSLMKLELPFEGVAKHGNHKLGFAFLEDQVADEYGNELTVKDYVSTGHSHGLITINLDEADPSKRLKMREQLQERYRTLLGHFRHESGHFFWDLLINNSDFLEEFRSLFGDERLDYQAALQNYYQSGPAPEWEKVWISAYASMHPWEDWAETWAHYLHMVDTLETANNMEFSIGENLLLNPLKKHDHKVEQQEETIFDQMFDDWCTLSITLNALNRSMGLDDAYPFVISSSAINKLHFVHRVIESSAVANIKY
ncbi:zinc-binding metallopeptidase family protein [Glaciecola sp. 1036]|uniref:zinc-binding metallopeptidase family protein n=1 Tax=Alteromonadaceae TaxID=72275 RepID=UPI003D043DD3